MAPSEVTAEKSIVVWKPATSSHNAPAGPSRGRLAVPATDPLAAAPHRVQRSLNWLLGCWFGARQSGSQASEAPTAVEAPDPGLPRSVQFLQDIAMPHLMKYAPRYLKVMTDEHFYGTGKCADIETRVRYVSLELDWPWETREKLNNDLALMSTWWQALRSPGTLSDWERRGMTRGLRNRIALIVGLRPGVDVDYAMLFTAIKRRQLLVNPSGAMYKKIEKLS